MMLLEELVRRGLPMARFDGWPFLHLAGYADRMPLTQFRRRFQVLAQPVMKKYTSAYETTDEEKVGEEAAWGGR